MDRIEITGNLIKVDFSGEAKKLPACTSKCIILDGRPPLEWTDSEYTIDEELAILDACLRLDNPGFFEDF